MMQEIYGWEPRVGGGEKFNPQTKEFTHYPLNSSKNLDSNSVTLLYIDQHKTLWVATYFSGLFKINMITGDISRYGHDPANTNSLTTDELLVITGEKDNLWVGTTKGLDKFNKSTGKWTHYLPSSSILSLFLDANKILWAGTEIGLFKYDVNKDDFLRYSDPATGISIGRVLNIIEDDTKNLWITSREHIYKINAARNAVQAYGEEYGVRQNGLLFGDNFKGNGGKLIMGNEHGYYEFDPKEFQFESVPPSFYISAFRMGNKEVKPGKGSPVIEDISTAKEVRLASNQNSFSFEFNALNYVATEKISFRYWLENYDSTWVELGLQNKAYFFNLPPGQYTLRVRAVSNTGSWSERSLAVNISPPWWQTWWGILLQGAGLALLVSLVSYFRSRQLRRQNKLLEEKVNHRTRQLKESIENLKATQSQLVQSEKMASLGELTAGIAHEIQNPLNFVNNFSEINNELLAEMNEEIEMGNFDQVKALAKNITDNEGKINYHGNRADSIVKGMLQHSRASNGKKELTDINLLADEYLRLAYHGLRAKDKTFNAAMKTEFDPEMGSIQVLTQDMGRVILNLITNALYAVNEKAQNQTAGSNSYQPVVTVTTQRLEDSAIIKVSDNADGIPPGIEDKIFQPFFTTKPAGQGTGLGLSMSYEIITKGHNGSLTFSSTSGKGTTFIISIPLNSPATS